MVDYLANVRTLMNEANAIKNTDVSGVLDTVQNIYGVAFQIQNNWVGTDANQYITELVAYQPNLIHLINFISLRGKNSSDFALAVQTNVQNNIQIQNATLGAEGVLVNGSFEEIQLSPSVVDSFVEKVKEIRTNLSSSKQEFASS